ncbi:hypothetical protein D3C80_1944410 [compost metagenome]
MNPAFKVNGQEPYTWLTPRTGATATCAVGGRLRSAAAVELLTGNATVNEIPILRLVRFMDHVPKNRSEQSLKRDGSIFIP